MMILNKLQDSYSHADLFLRARTDGFIFRTSGVDPAMLDLNAPKESLNAIYAKIENDRAKGWYDALQKTVNHRVAVRKASEPVPSFMVQQMLVMDREFAHKGLQPEIENPLPVSAAGWISDLSKPEIQKFGFVIYRLGYEYKEGEWEDVMSKINAQVAKGWGGVVGFEDVGAKVELEWVDGWECGIEEGDFDAARK